MHGDFYALLSKVPHGPIANAKPLLDFTTMWKLITVHIDNQYIPPAYSIWCLALYSVYFACSILYGNLLCVLHDFMWFLDIGAIVAEIRAFLAPLLGDEK